MRKLALVLYATSLAASSCTPAYANPAPPTGPVVETCGFLPAGTPCPRPRPRLLCWIIPIICWRD